MTILRTILRFVLIIVLVGLLVWLSIKIFKLIPKAINNLASATVSIGGLTDEKAPTTPVTTTGTPTSTVPTTADGLNGVVLQPTPIPVTSTTGTTNTGTTPNPTKINTGSGTTGTTATNNPTTRPVTPSYTGYQYVNTAPTQAYSYYPEPREEYSPAGGKNIKLTVTSVGIIDPNSGRFVSTNSFNVNDTVSVKFKILNEEDTSTGPWDLSVIMPASDPADRTKHLTNLSNIPGESSYAGEARFTGIDLSNGTPVVRIYADPNNRIAERNENDNTLAIELRNVNGGAQIYQYPLDNYYNTYPYNYYDTNYNDNYYYNNNYNPGYYNNGGYYNNNNQCYSHVYGYYNCGSTSNGYDYGTPNLDTYSVEIGRMIGGSFYQTTTIPYGERVSVRVRVRNTGGYFNNQWNVRVTSNNQGTGYREFYSGYNAPLQPGGEQVVYFDLPDLIRGNHSLTITLDAQNNIAESSETDNVDTASVYIN